MTRPFCFPRPPRPPGNPQPAPTFQALTRWLSPWRTIRKLEAENRQLRRSNDRLADMVFLACSRNVAKDRRLRKCPTHGQQPPNAWGCPECVRELRGELATAREALRRLVRYSPYEGEVVRGVYLWATDNGMTGPLPPLPDHIKRDQLTTQLTTEDQP